MRFEIAGNDAAAFASRGQQRTAGLALRLAEVALSRDRTGDAPVLLLDDILSELDEERRGRVLAAAYGVDQVVITSADEERPSAEDLPGARRFRIEGGELRAGRVRGVDRYRLHLVGEQRVQLWGEQDGECARFHR